MSTTTTAPTLVTRMIAEAIGTLVLVFAGIGTALYAVDAAVGTLGTPMGVGHLGIALAVGLTVLVGVYVWGPISGGHFNPAVTLGMAIAGRFAWRDVLGYWAAQVVGGLVGSTLLVLVGLFGPDGWLSRAQSAGFASNGFGEHSPGGWGIGAAIIAEVILTCVFVLVVAGSVSSRAPVGFAGIAIGLALTLIHLVSIPIDGTSVNPARSIATAVYGGVAPLAQLWVFIVFPLVGGAIAGIVHRALFPEPTVR
ncbi:aquaporin Z [Microbacterium sp. SYP-A9085]|jgi:aquaporin Z|uniref:aquaporin n=1 Tax=Microbacterium sp. SYP-A9085 TaxID=2664454 RepID=UPI00129AD966|nr:aquaporin [Microbacterium sp. SYP-A9085]MRH28892.1 aquaporin Z [Microbacterium sp. SYP-A9085]